MSLIHEGGAPLHSHGLVDVEAEALPHGEVHVAEGEGDVVSHVLGVVEPQLVLFEVHQIILQFSVKLVTYCQFCFAVSNF